MRRRRGVPARSSSRLPVPPGGAAQEAVPGAPPRRALPAARGDHLAGRGAAAARGRRPRHPDRVLGELEPGEPAAACAQQDSLLAARPELPLDILAISHEEPATLRPSSPRPAGSASASAATPRAPTGRPPSAPSPNRRSGRRGALPFAFVVGETAAGPGRLLWMGPLVEIYDENPHAAFDTALARALAGSFDLAAAKEAIRQEERSLALFGDLDDSRQAGNYPRLSALLDELARPTHPLHRSAHGRQQPERPGLDSGRPKASPRPLRWLWRRRPWPRRYEYGASERSGRRDHAGQGAQLRGDLAEAIALQRRAVAMVPADRRRAARNARTSTSPRPA